MPTRFVHVTVDAADKVRLARFWSELLGWPVTFQDTDEVYLEAPAEDGSGLGMAVVAVPDPKIVKNRAHLDLARSSAEHQRELVARALDLGATRTDIGQRDVPWSVLADPEDNEFCVLEPRPEYADTGVLAAIVQDCPDPVALAGFWSAASGWPIHRWGPDYASLRRLGRGPWLELLRSDDPKEAKQRMHMDVAPFAGDDHAAEVTRLLELGARHADIGQGDVPWAVLTDPQGNELCVLSPR